MVKILAMGNPHAALDPVSCICRTEKQRRLLDMQVRDGEALLEKYGLKPNDAVLASPEQMPIYDEVKQDKNVHYVAGGAAQNAARAAQYCMPAGSTAYLGCVGADDLADQLRAANEKEGLKSAYQVLPKGSLPTGACAVVITGHNRSLCTTLGAAEKFSPAHLETDEVKALIQEAQLYYLGGFFLTHGLHSALSLAKQSAQADKTFAMNLSAPFIAQFFKSQVDEIMPYLDIVFGNESEAAAWATAHDMTEDLSAIASKIASQPKENTSKPRIVVITHGAEATIVAQREFLAKDAKDAQQKEVDVKTYQPDKLDESKIVDTNGAGDAFAGAFIAAIALGKSVEAAVEAGHKLGQQCVGQVGPTFKWPKVKII